MKLAYNYVLNCFSLVFSRSYKMNRLVAVVVGVMGMAFVASAAPVYFTDDAFEGANGKSSFTSEDYGITLTASPEGAELTRSSAGIGVDYSRLFFDDLPYEIDYPEVLTISFDKEVNLESVYISNLFTDQIFVKIFGKKIVLASWEEEGSYELSDGEIGYFVTANDNGKLALDINKTVSSISFSANAETCLGLLHDFSIEGVSYTSIPEPATSVPEPAMLSFLGISLLGLGFVRNRKK